MLNHSSKYGCQHTANNISEDYTLVWLKFAGPYHFRLNPVRCRNLRCFRIRLSTPPLCRHNYHPSCSIWAGHPETLGFWVYHPTSPDKRKGTCQRANGLHRCGDLSTLELQMLNTTCHQRDDEIAFVSLDPKSNNQNDGDEHDEGDIQKTSPYTSLRLVCSQIWSVGQLTTAHQRIYLLPSQLVPATGAGRRSGEPLMLRNYRVFSVSFLDEKERINHQTMQNWSESSHQHTFWKQRYHRNQTGQFFAPLDVQAWLKNGVLSIPIIRFWESIIFSHTISISKLHLCQPIFNRDCANSKHWSLDSSDLAAARAC